MISELSQEDIVTQLLISNEIVEKSDKNFYVTNSEMKISKDLRQFMKETKLSNEVMYIPSEKYSFIKNGLWNY